MILNGFGQRYVDELAVSKAKQVQGHTTDVNLPWRANGMKFSVCNRVKGK